MDDDGESVKLAVGTLPMGVSAGSTRRDDAVAIADDDDPQVTVSFGASTYSVAEGGTVEVTVTLDKDPERTVSIPLTTTNQGGASSASDYSGVPARPDLQQRGHGEELHLLGDRRRRGRRWREREAGLWDIAPGGVGRNDR